MAVPPYQRLAARLRELISTGAWPPGYRTPSHAQLQAEYAVGRGVVERAVAQLRREGLLEGVRRARPVVAYPPAVRTLVDPDADWPLVPDAQCRESRPSAGTDLAARLGVAAGTRLACRMVELVDPSGVTVGLCTTWQRGRHRRHSTARFEVSLHSITGVEAEMTGLAAGAPAWLLQRVRYDIDGAPVQAADMVLPVDRWRIGLTPMVLEVVTNS